MANILYLSCHAILEYSEVKLFTELGHTVFSDGVYRDPKGHKSLPRPGIEGMKYFPEFEQLSNSHPKTNLAQEIIDWADIIMVMHTPEWITENWERIKHKKVIWRSIGQSTKHVENMIRRMRYEGMKIVRYSGMEQNIPDYLGTDAIIPFYQDPDEWHGWNGDIKRVINFTQSLLGRRYFCHYDQIMSVINGFPALIYGTGNDNLGGLNGGELPYDLMKGALRDNRVFIYGGTWPAAYTLAFQEALMTGIPIVALGTQLAEEIENADRGAVGHYYELENIIENGINGFISNDIGQLRGYIHELLESYDLASAIGKNGRETAIKLYGKEKVAEQWKEFLNSL